MSANVSIRILRDRKEWYRDGLLHRDDGPAVEFKNGDCFWYQNGQLHREDGPAVEDDGTTQWFLHGKIHRDGGPAVEEPSGYKIWFQNGKRHRVDGYAEVIPNGCKTWYQNGKIHRLDGPAVIFADKSKGNNEWWIDNKFVSSPSAIKMHQINRLQSIYLAFSPLELPPYVIFWILEWSESAYIDELSQREVIKMFEGIRNSRVILKSQ